MNENTRNLCALFLVLLLGKLTGGVASWWYVFAPCIVPTLFFFWVEFAKGYRLAHEKKREEMRAELRAREPKQKRCANDNRNQ